MRSLAIRENADMLIAIGATNALPIVITTLKSHNVVTGDLVDIVGFAGNLAANVTRHPVTKVSATTFSLDDVRGSGVIRPDEKGTVVPVVPSNPTYTADTALNGELYTFRDLPEDAKCRFVVDADQDPTLSTKECNLDLVGRANSSCEWVVLGIIDNSSAWQNDDTNWISVVNDMQVWPEMSIIVRAFASSTTEVRAWIIVDS